MDLERELTALDVEWPATPAFRLEPAPRRRRRPLVAVALAVAVAVAAAFAVPSSRGAILRFLHLRGVTIERVERLPPAQERPLAAGLGPVVTPAEAAQALGRPPLLPALDPEPPLHVSNGVASFVVVDGGQTVLVSELAGTAVLFKKFATIATGIERVPHGLWITGAPHDFLFPDAAPRLAGDVLLVERGSFLVRVEGPGLAKADALRIAAGLR